MKAEHIFKVIEFYRDGNLLCITITIDDGISLVAAVEKVEKSCDASGKLICDRWATQVFSTYAKAHDAFLERRKMVGAAIRKTRSCRNGR